MAGRFDYFVILAGMRTGSNFLEANLNEYPGLTCHGELFNPHFIGHLKTKELFGFTLAEREKDPMALVAWVRERTEGLAGFRLFDGHDPRVLAACLEDPRAAKIVLSRNPLESYVSLKIAGETGQWRLGDLKDAKSAAVAFDREEFLRYLSEVRTFQETILRRVQASGQTAFFLTYEDVPNVEVMNGLARFLGVEEGRKQTSASTKKQNPAGLQDKVTNYPEMVAALSSLDPFGLESDPVFEHKRGGAVPNYVAAANAPLMFLPVLGGPVAAVEDWMTRLDGGPELRRGFDRKSVRQWLRQSKGHRTFTVIRHPVARLYDTFNRFVLATGEGAYLDIRQTLREVYEVRLPDDPEDRDWDEASQRQGFLDFIRFVSGNLSGQTSIRIDGAWASQAAVLQGISQLVLPDAILREDELEQALPALARAAGAAPVEWRPLVDQWPHPLSAIYDKEVEAQVRQAYQRDYMLFGFRPWG